jgi:16S rRNA (guanine966-N2)-methyltransferase
VFIDPPYDVAATDLSEMLELLVPSLGPDATVILERASRSPEPVLPAGLAHVRDKKYGDTTLWWVRPLEEASAEAEVTASG